MKQIGFILLMIIFICMQSTASAEEYIITGLDGFEFDSNDTYENTSHTQDDNRTIVLGTSADNFDRSNNADVGTNWLHYTHDLQIYSNCIAAEGDIYAAEIEIDANSNINSNPKYITLTTNDAASNYFGIIFNANSNSSLDDGYIIRVRGSYSDVMLYYINGASETLISDVDLGDDQFSKITFDISNVSSGVKVYNENGNLVHTTSGNSSYSSGYYGIALAHNTWASTACLVKSYRVHESLNGNFTTRIYNSSDKVIKSANVEYTSSGGSSNIDLQINSSTDNVNWTNWHTFKTNAATNINYDIPESYQNQYWALRGMVSNTDFDETIIIQNINATIDFVLTPPNITSFTTTDFSEYENVQFQLNATADQIGNWTLYADNVLVQSNISVSSIIYINSTALEGLHNYTATITNANGTDSVQWNVTMVSNSWDSYVINETQTLIWFETSNYTAGLQGFNIIWANRTGTTGNTSTLYYQNGTSITSNSTYGADGNVTLIPGFLIPEETYYIEETVSASTQIIPANSWGMFNNWTGDMTFAGIAANESNDVCYTYYNVTSGLWESYYMGYSWNADYQLSKDASVIGYFDAQTDITSNIITPSSTELYTGWNMVALQGSSNKTISEIIADI